MFSPSPQVKSSEGSLPSILIDGKKTVLALPTSDRWKSSPSTPEPWTSSYPPRLFFVLSLAGSVDNMYGAGLGNPALQSIHSDPANKSVYDPATWGFNAEKGTRLSFNNSNMGSYPCFASKRAYLITFHQVN